MNATQLRALADVAEALARLARAAADDNSQPSDEHLPEREAARIAGVSLRTLRDARRRGELVVYGKQRSRTIKRADLSAWVESRLSRPVGGHCDADIERRMRRIARRKGRAA
jgi:hypothetical protein